LQQAPARAYGAPFAGQLAEGRVSMAILRLSVSDFTVFGRAVLDLAPGINVLVGENATGKTHLLKLLYGVARGTHAALRRRGWEQDIARGLAGIFGLQQEESLQPLIRRGATEPQVDILVAGRRAISLRMDAGGVTGKATVGAVERPVLLPSREIISVFPGFAEANRRRELAFDETYLDLADALALQPLKGAEFARVRPLLAMVELALGGRESRKAGRFQVKLGEDSFEAQLVAEGLRKMAQVARLVRNGSIAPGVLLLWDEPEASLNPVLLRKVVELLLALARGKVQVVLATHDYLLTQTLSLHAEHPRRDTPPMRFFGLERGSDGAVRVAGAKTIAGIRNNPILREHARQYDLEVAAIEGDRQ